MWKWIKWKLKIGWEITSIHVRWDDRATLFGCKIVEWTNKSGEKRVVMTYGFVPYL